MLVRFLYSLWLSLAFFGYLWCGLRWVYRREVRADGDALVRGAGRAALAEPPRVQWVPNDIDDRYRRDLDKAEKARVRSELRRLTGRPHLMVTDAQIDRGLAQLWREIKAVE